MPLELREITKDNWRPIARLSDKLDEQQRRYVAHNAISMLDAIYHPDHLWVRGAYEDDTPVGFVMYADIRDEEPNSYYIVRLMVSPEHQGKGYGRAIMLHVIDLLKAMPQCEKIYISFVPQNETARRLYSSLGFEDTGRVEEGEAVYLLRVAQDKPEAAG